MNLRVEAAIDELTVYLKEGTEETSVTVAPPHAGAATLTRALADAAASGYGECFWPSVTGQYWWMFRRDHETVEVAVMWSRGGASGWQHVFRATDALAWVRGRLDEELARVGV
jgi:hypothetical protein